MAPVFIRGFFQSGKIEFWKDSVNEVKFATWTFALDEQEIRHFRFVNHIPDLDEPKRNGIVRKSESTIFLVKYSRFCRSLNDAVNHEVVRHLVLLSGLHHHIAKPRNPDYGDKD